MQPRVRVNTDAGSGTALGLYTLQLLGTLRHPCFGWTVDIEYVSLNPTVTRNTLTDDKPLVVQALQRCSMVLGYNKHALYPLARSLLAEHHLQDSRVYRFTGYLTAELVELPVGYFEVRGGVLVLSKDMIVSAHGQDINRIATTYLSMFLCHSTRIFLARLCYGIENASLALCSIRLPGSFQLFFCALLSFANC